MRATIGLRQLAEELSERLPLGLVLVLGIDLPSAGVIAGLDGERPRHLANGSVWSNRR